MPNRPPNDRRSSKLPAGLPVEVHQLAADLRLALAAVGWEVLYRPVPMSGAEKTRRWRQRLRAAQAAGAQAQAQMSPPTVTPPPSQYNRKSITDQIAQS
jgi:hypothetical protein